MSPRKEIPRKMRAEIYNRDLYCCRYCNKKLEDNKTGSISLDHVIPRCKGGSDTKENLVTACAQCQWKKGSKLPDETELKLLANCW